MIVNPRAPVCHALNIVSLKVIKRVRQDGISLHLLFGQPIKLAIPDPVVFFNEEQTEIDNSAQMLLALSEMLQKQVPGELKFAATDNKFTGYSFVCFHNSRHLDCSSIAVQSAEILHSVSWRKWPAASSKQRLDSGLFTNVFFFSLSWCLSSCFQKATPPHKCQKRHSKKLLMLCTTYVF